MIRLRGIREGENHFVGIYCTLLIAMHAMPELSDCWERATLRRTKQNPGEPAQYHQPQLCSRLAAWQWTDTNHP
jgi:hypothetical protein